MVDGSWPEKRLYISAMDLRVEMLKIEGGMEPVKLLFTKFKNCRLCRLPISGGSVPANI